MTVRFTLETGPPESLSESTTLYFLGVGGPEDASGIGDIDAFVWRFLVLKNPDSQGHRTVVAFTSMPNLMAFTRGVNQRRPFTVPTEALRLQADDLPKAQGLTVWLDPVAADWTDTVAARSTQEAVDALGPS